MLDKIIKIDNGFTIGLWHITETTDELKQQLDDTEYIESVISSLGSQKRVLEVLAVRVLLKNMLKEEAKISYNSYGKPFLEGKDMNISITHKGNYVGIILNPKKAVGIDIEKLSQKVVRVKDKFLTNIEQTFIEPTAEIQQMTIMWCVKEVLYKLIDKTIDNLKEEVQILPFVPYIEGAVEAIYMGQNFKIEYVLDHENCVAWSVYETI